MQFYSSGLHPEGETSLPDLFVDLSIGGFTIQFPHMRIQTLQMWIRASDVNGIPGHVSIS
jgi:hypothetical protein